MPLYFSYDRPQFAGPVSTAVAQPLPRSPTPVSSYTSLDHALGTEGARDTNNAVSQPPTSQPGQPHPSQMASDGRYVYHAPPEVTGHYAYSSYSTPSYEPPQLSHTMSRPPARSASAQAHSPHVPSQPYPPAYPPQSPYGHPAYSVVPTPSWTGEGWHQYPHTFPPPHPPGQDPHYSSNGARPDISASDHRPYQPGPSRPESHRPEERPRPPEAPPQPKVRKPRESDPPSPVSPRPTSLGLDFHKLTEQYGFVLDTSQGLLNEASSTTGRATIAPESMERMSQAAAFGFQAIDSAGRRVAQAEVQRTPPERSPVESEAGTSQQPRPQQQQQQQQQPQPQQQQSQSQQPQQPDNSQPNTEGQTCLGCNATSTPEWRRGPMGPRTLCNACGLVYAKLLKKRSRDPARMRGSFPGGAKLGAQGAHALVDDAANGSDGDGGSDDEDSYGSQERRSDSGFHGGRD
ncbi:uncharacterized protein FIBRA_04684 [Fibroporia radiculosa]|uniref:GATA-type domain-containing protein n=1 Tax=Fibroporia radiculosa TaxID=599839 RepID=J4IAA7_9APHY|nr:uncharacterized protein FIBRA_04684 [Fibroporia radiculosa]CCM02581.1 predicted protein [Fibroporia radiculosa]